MATININTLALSDAVFDRIRNALKQTVILKRVDYDNNNRLTEIERFDALIRPNTGSNRDTEQGVIVSGLRKVIRPINNVSELEIGDIIETLDGIRYFINQDESVNDLKKYLAGTEIGWIHSTI